MIKPEALMARLFVACLTCMVMFVVLDRISRRFVSSRTPLERSFPVSETRRPKPYVMFGGVAGVRDLNAQGYRGPAATMPPAPREYRIFLLGGSTVFNGTPPIAELVQRRLAAVGWAEARVYNFGVQSSVSSMELARIVFEIADLAPDLIVFYNGNNDFDHPRHWDPRPGYPFDFIAYEANPLLSSDIEHYPALTMFAYGSNLLRAYTPSLFSRRFVRLSEARRGAGWDTEEWKDSIAAVFVRNQVKAHRISQAFGARFIGFFQPVLAFKRQLSTEELDLDREDHRAYALDMRERIRGRMAAARDSTGARLVDLSELFRDTTRWAYTDRAHPRQWTHEVIAAAIAGEILAMRGGR